MSSSLSDCSSSFDVSSSSLADWYSSFTDMASSFIALNSSLEVARSRAAVSSSSRVASSSRSSSAIRDALAGGAAPRLASFSAFGPSMKLTSSSSPPSLSTRRTSILTEIAPPSRSICASVAETPACSWIARWIAALSLLRNPSRAMATTSREVSPAAMRK